MLVEKLEAKHLSECAQLLTITYNCAPWNDNWSLETAVRYLNEYITSQRFVGFIIKDSDKIAGAIFCREKTWWNADELYIDEFFISPEHQKKGFGKMLMNHLEQYAKYKNLSGITLLTHKAMPAYKFYEKNGFTNAEQIVFMYKGK